MRNKYSRNLSFWSNIVNAIQNLISLFLKSLWKNRSIIERIQLTFIYFFASVVFSYSIQSYLSGALPEFIYFFFPDIDQFLLNPYLKILSTPEKTFILYFIILQLLMTRSTLFSLLVKFNILLIFILEMFQNLIIAWWDLLVHREIEYGFDATNGLWIHDLANSFFSLMYLFFLLVYLYSYVKSMTGKFPTFPGNSRFITDSVAFWLQIKVKEQKN